MPGPILAEDCHYYQQNAAQQKLLKRPLKFE
jgi:hypothetical protein